MIRTWEVENLDCASCTAEIEHKLSLETGVKEARLNFMAKKLTIESEKNQDAEFWKNLEHVAKSVRPELVLQSQTLSDSRTWRIDGLDCASCGDKVERAIAAIEGVSSVTLEIGRAHV